MNAHYLYFVSVMFADQNALYAEKCSNRPHLASSYGSYHVGNENEELQSSQANRPVKRIYVHVQKRKEKRWLFTAGCLQRLEKAICQWLL